MNPFNNVVTLHGLSWGEFAGIFSCLIFVTVLCLFSLYVEHYLRLVLMIYIELLYLT